MSNQAELSQAIATVERQISEAKSEVAKKSLNAKLDRLKEELKSGAKKGTSTLATLSSARKSVRKLASKDFTALIEKLSAKPEYAFLKGYSKDKLKDDIVRVAKPVGYRFVGDNTKKPTIPQIKKGLKDGTVYYEARPIRSDVSRVVQLKEGGKVEDCIDYIKNSESIKNNGYYLHINSLNNYVDSGVKIPKIKPFCLITFNSGGQKNLKAIDTINATLLSSEIAKLLNIDIELARIIVSEQTTRSKRFTMAMLDKIKNNNIIVADRETIVCTNLSNKYAEGGNIYSDITEKEFLTKYFGANTFVGDPSQYFDIKNLSSSNDSKVELFIADLKKEGYSIKKKSYSGFTSVMGVKKKNKMAEGGNIESSIDKLYEKAGFINDDMNWQFKLLEMLQDGSSEAHDIYQGLSEEQKEEVLQELYDMDNDMGSNGEGNMETSKENLEIMLHDAESGHKYAKGGNIASFNWKNFTLKELSEALPTDVEILKYDTRFIKGFSPSEAKNFYTNKKLTISQHGEAEISKGGENIYLEIKCYNAEDKNDMSEYEVKIYSKENHKGLKEVANAVIEKMKLGGTIDNSFLGRTSIGKSFYGWKATTSTTKQIKGYDWEITTMKRYGGELVSTATGGKSMKQDGYSTFEYSPFEDPNYSLVRSKPKMVNEKAVTKQHEEALKIFIEKMNEMKGNIMKYGGSVKAPIKVKKRLEAIRKSIQNENVSYGELAELQNLSQYIDPSDVELREAAGMPEFDDDDEMKYGGKTKSQSTKNIYIETIAGKTGLRAEAIETFVSENNLSDKELLNLVQGIGTRKLESNDLISAVVGIKGNKKISKVVAFAKSDKAFSKMANGGTLEDNLLPPSKTYGENIAKAMEKFDISNNEARKRYGSYTIKQWSELLGEKMGNGGEVGDISKSEIPRMQKITKLKGLYGYMPSINAVYYDSKTDKFYFQDFEGDYMEVRNISTLEQLDKFLKENNITLDKKMATGGSIPDNYEGKTPEDIWNSLSKRQRQHFLYDHLSEIEAYKNTGQLPSSEIIKAYNSEWSTLDRDIKNRFTNHTREGQYATGGSVGGKKYSYLPNEDISKIVLKSKQVIGADRILDGAYIKSSKSAKKATDPEMERAMRTLEKLKSEGKLKRLYDVRGNGKKSFETIIPNKEDKGYWKRYESASNGSIGILQNELLSEEDVLNHILKTQPKLAKPTTRELYERFESEKKTIALGMIARGVAEEFMRDKFDKTMDWDKLSDEEKEEYNKAYKVKLNMFDNFLVSEFLELYYEKESIREKCKGTSRKTIDAIESVLRNIAKEYPEEKYAKGGGVSPYYGGMSEAEILKATVVYDNGGETLDRYTVFTPDSSVFGMSATGGGFNQYIGDDSEIEKGSHLGKRLKTVPKDIKSAVLNRMKEEFGDGGSMYADGGSVNSKYYTLWSDEQETIKTDFDKYEDALSDFKQFENSDQEIKLYEIGNGKPKLLKRNNPSNNITYIKLSNSEVVVEIEKRDGKWVEGSVLEGEEPYGWGGKTYMGYLKPNDIVSWLNRDYKSNFQIIEQYAHGGSMYKKGGNTGYAYVPNADIEKIIAKDGKEYGQKVLLDGAYVKDKVRTPKMSRTQFEEDVYAYGKGGSVNLEKHIWEGWTVGDFIQELEPTFNQIMSGRSWQKPFTSKQEVKEWCMDNQPYYKKHIPEVVNYFWAKMDGDKMATGGAIEIQKMKKEKEKMVSELFEKCGVFFAFSDKQFEENKTPLKEGEKYVSIGGGGYLPKGKVKELEEGMEAIERFGKQTVKKKNLVEAEILDELQNHECFYTGDISDVVDLFEGTYTKQQIRDVYNKHREANQEYALGGEITAEEREQALKNYPKLNL